MVEREFSGDGLDADEFRHGAFPPERFVLPGR
jgi:hypothetical protein